MERRSFLGGMTLAALSSRAGTVERGGTFEDNTSRVFDVRQYGAAGDGRTDDTIAIRRAFAELNKGGGVLSLPPGDYVVSGPLDLPTAAAWHVRGAGRTVSRIRLGGAASRCDLFHCTHGHTRPTFGCSIQDLSIDAGGFPGTTVRLDGLTLFGMRGVTIARAGGTALSLVGLFDSYFEDVFLEGCGTSSEPALSCTSQGDGRGQSMNNCVFVNVHVESGADAVQVFIDGSQNNPTDTLQFYGLKCHGSPQTGMPARPLLQLGRFAIGCSFSGGLIAWGKGVSQVEVDGRANKFIGIDHGAAPPGGSPEFAYRFTEHAVGNHILTPNFKNAVAPNQYRSGYVRVESGASHTKLLFPQMSTGPLLIERVVSDEGRGTLFLGDDVSDARGLYLRHSQGFNVLRANGISTTATPAWNLRGSVTLSGGSDKADVRFPTPEADAGYFVTCTVTGIKGSPAAAARRIWISNKNEKGFQLRAEGAPGGDAAVTADWILVR
jgi:hypothetical protein